MKGKNIMKKNKMMRIASVLLIAVLLSTCAISGTFAKYTTYDESSDAATVAKFGVTVTADYSMFSDSYKNAKTTYTENETGDAITVQASTAGNKILAPGTEGALAGLSVTGTPEVDVVVTYTAVLTLTGWEANGEYCPLEITVGTTKYKIGDNATDIADLKAKVEAAIAACTKTYDTNTDLSEVNDDVAVSWAWAFTGNDDVKDTILGDAATATIDLKITTTISQVN